MNFHGISWKVYILPNQKSLFTLQQQNVTVYTQNWGITNSCLRLCSYHFERISLDYLKT